MSKFPLPPQGDDPERDLARRARRVGISKDEYLTRRTRAIMEQATIFGWNGADLDRAVLDVRTLAEEIWT